jgi:hypothetical protein
VLDHVVIGVSDFLSQQGFHEGARESSGPVHVAFVSPDRATVDAFHKAALAAGGRDNGTPGLR